MIGKFLPYLKAHRWQVAWALAQVFLVAGFELLKPWPKKREPRSWTFPNFRVESKARTPATLP